MSALVRSCVSWSLRQVAQGQRSCKHTICSEADSSDRHSAASSGPRLGRSACLMLDGCLHGRAHTVGMVSSSVFIAVFGY